MVSSLGDSAGSAQLFSQYSSILQHFPESVALSVDIQQMFVLIDGVLPIEACLYYQVLPLHLQGNCLVLGMVNPEDAAAAEYVRRIISYHNYYPKSTLIASDALQASLSAYLNYSGSKSSAASEPQVSQSVRRPQRAASRGRVHQPIDRNAQPTLVVDSPEDLNELRAAELEKPEAVSPPPALPFTPAADFTYPLTTLQAASEVDALEIQTLAPLPLDYDVPLTTLQDFGDAADASAHPIPLTTLQDNADDPEPSPPVPPAALLLPVLPPLEVTTHHLISPIEVLATLPPSELLQELLGRILVGGIGRLYFEQQPRYGRILWSQNGVLQSVVDRLEKDQFQLVLNELKQLAQVPLEPAKQAYQVETERLYEQMRLLLRFRFIPMPTGEEATLQVLRGAALKFYQQQQLAHLERDALSIARQLQAKLNEIRDRARQESSPAAARLEVLPALSTLLKTIEDQIGQMQREDVG